MAVDTFCWFGKGRKKIFKIDHIPWVNENCTEFKIKRERTCFYHYWILAPNLKFRFRRHPKQVDKNSLHNIYRICQCMNILWMKKKISRSSRILFCDQNNKTKQNKTKTIAPPYDYDGEKKVLYNNFARSLPIFKNKIRKPRNQFGVAQDNGKKQKKKKKKKKKLYNWMEVVLNFWHCVLSDQRQILSPKLCPHNYENETGIWLYQFLIIAYVFTLNQRKLRPSKLLWRHHSRLATY